MMQLLIQQNNTRDIELEERGLQFGDGVYEVIRLYKGNFHLLRSAYHKIISLHGRNRIITPFSKA